MSEPDSLRVAYVMSRFPKLTETFILYELRAMRGRGVAVDVWPLLRERVVVSHPEAAEEAARANYLPFVSRPIVASIAWFLWHRPATLVRAVGAVLAGCWGSLNFFVGAFGILPKAIHAARRMEVDGVDHVHCHFASHPAVAGYVIHALTGIPFSFVAHGSDLHVDRHMLPQKVAAAAFVLAVSDDNRRVILDTCGNQHAAKVVVAHCGVDSSVFAPPAARDDDGVLDIVCVGTLHEVKGQRHLLGALARLRARGVDARVTFIGDGPDRARLQEQADALGLDDVVTFSGPRTRSEVLAAMHRADVLVAPSVPTKRGKREGIPVVLMEAMSTGLPVVASRLSGIPELVRDGVEGLLVEPGDEDAIADALAALAGDPAARTALGERARARVLDEFDLDTQVRRLVERIQARRPAVA